MGLAYTDGSDQEHSLFFQRILLHKTKRITMSISYRERNLMQLQIEVGQSAIFVAGRDAGFFQQLLIARGDAAITARHAAGFTGNLDLLPAGAVTYRAGLCRLRLM